MLMIKYLSKYPISQYRISLKLNGYLPEEIVLFIKLIYQTHRM